MTFRKQLLLGFGGILSLMFASGIVSLTAFRSAIDDAEELSRGLGRDLVDVERLRYGVEKLVATSRGALLDRQAPGAAFEQARSRLFAQLGDLKSSRDPTTNGSLDNIEQAARTYCGLVETALAARRHGAEPEQTAAFFDEVLKPAREALDSAVTVFVQHERTVLDTRVAVSRAATRRAGVVVALGTFLGLMLGLALAVALHQRLSVQFEGERAAREMARRAVEARDDVLAIVSHDLRNPLAAVLLSCDMLRREGAGMEDRVKRRVESMHTAARHMQHLIENLLEAVRFETQGPVLNLGLHAVAPVLTDVAAMFQQRAQHADVTLTVHSPPEEAHVRVDRERLVQVLANLVGNAIKFTPAGGAVDLGCVVTPQEIVFTVKDTGIGIPADQQSLVFERSWQAQRGGRAGLGLGLYIVKRIVQAHGGRLWLESELGRGSAFHVAFPA